MRIAMVCPYDLGVPGGVQGQAVGLARAVARLEHEVLLIAPTGPGSTLPTLDGVQYAPAGRTMRVPVNGSQAPIAPTPAAWRQTREHLQRFEPQVIHVHEPFVPGAAMAAVTSSSVPIVGTFHRSGAGPLYRAMRPLLLPVAKRLGEAVVVSNEAGATLDAVLGSNALTWQVLANGIELERFAPRSVARGEPPTIVFVGRHEERKGLAVLLAAFAQLERPAKLVVAGSGPLTATLQAQTRGDAAISWLGAITDEQVAELLGHADLFVAPALRGESFGVVLLEAMAAGAPVVAADLPGYRLAADGAARFFPAGDAVALAASLRGLLDDPGETAALTTAGHRAAQRHSLEMLAQRYLEIFARLVRRL